MFFGVLLVTLAITVSSVLCGEKQHEREFCDADGCSDNEELYDSQFQCSSGHHPYQTCSFTHVMLDKQAKTFRVHNLPEVDSLPVSNTWNVTNTEEAFRCDRTVKDGYAFLFYYYHGSTNYFHLHYDTMIPLYAMLKEWLPQLHQRSVLLMPSVETSRLKSIDWYSDAFKHSEQKPIWTQMLSIFGPDEIMLPLSAVAWGSDQERICFEQLHLGVKKVDFSDSNLITGYVQFVKEQLGVASLPLPQTPRVGLITRKNRRRIINEEELVQVIRNAYSAELVEFTGLSFREQVRISHSFTVLIGINGAGLTNALFLPSEAVAVQLVPYNATNLNFKAFGTLLKSRGHYLEWHCSDPDSSVRGPTVTFENADTIVDSNELVMLLFEAFIVGINKDLIARM